jgi:hypothetical protein
MPPALLMPSDILPKPPLHGRGLHWIILPAAVAILLIGLFILLANVLKPSTPIEHELAAAMKSGMTGQQRIELSRRLVDMIERPTHGQPDTPLLLLSLGRIWQNPPRIPFEIEPARRKAVQTLLETLSSRDVSCRKAATLALVACKGDPGTPIFVCRPLCDRLTDSTEDLDVRIAAAVTLGTICLPSDKTVIAALEQARNLADERQSELAWNASLALARLGQPSATGTLLKLLDRHELSQLIIYDRESDPRNPQPRKLTDYEIERFLVNAMEASSALPEPAVKSRLRQLAQSDPSARVRTTASEILGRP